MRLPALSFQNKHQTRVITNYGLNLTQDFKDGELRDGYGLTSSDFPSLTQRKTWSAIPDYQDVTDIYEWDNKLVVIENHSLLYVDGNLIMNLDDYGLITTARRKFTVVNTKLVIFPDKVFYDVSNGEKGTLYERKQAYGVKFTNRTITVGNDFEEEESGNDYFLSLETGKTNVLINTYSGSGKVRDCYDDVNGQWDNYKLSNSQKTCGTTSMTFDGLSNGGYPMIKVGDFIIPKDDGYSHYDVEVGSYGDDGAEAPDITNYLQTPVFGLIQGVEHPECQYVGTEEISIYSECSTGSAVVGKIEEDALFNVLGSRTINGDVWLSVPLGSMNGGYVIYQPGKMNFSDDLPIGTVKLTVDYFSFQIDDSQKPFLNHIYKVGDVINISGTEYGINDAGSVTIESIDVEKNAITFAPSSDGGKVFNAPTYHIVKNSIQAGSYEMIFGISGSLAFDLNESINERVVLFTDENRNFAYVYGTNQKKVIKRLQKREAYITDTSLICSAWPDDYVHTERNVPDLDYICTSGNRLWGVSNETNTIYASVLGLPEDFYGNMAQADGAWQVAVASDNDFTAICPNGGNVYVFKEDRVIKVVGTNPAEFYTTEYEVAGVQNGSDRSVVSINNVLYYKGVNNVYVFSGYEPTPVGTNLGMDPLHGGIGWTDHKNYYLYLNKPDGQSLYGQSLLLGLNLRIGTWMPLDKNKRIEGTVMIGNVSHVLTGGTIYKQDGEGNSPLLRPSDDEWMAEYCPFKDGTTQHKGLTKLILYMDVDQGTTYDIEIKQDNGEWVKVYHGYATSHLTQCVPVRIGRCVRYAVRISGKGRAVIHEMKRETSIGSER